METKLFVSWCHEDERLKSQLLSPLTPRLSILKGCDVLWWEDSHIWTGERWREEILERIDECDYVLQLISPHFLASDFICENEIPPTVGKSPEKAALPVMLVDVPLDGSWDFQGIDEMQIFRHKTGKPRAFNQLRTAAEREEFATDLATDICRRIQQLPTWR